MPPPGLRSWSSIAHRYTHALLLGNGASIAFSPNFRYRDLLGLARFLGVIPADISALFRHFDTWDFELVMRLVWSAHELNELLYVEEVETERAFNVLRDALIQIVRQAHPSYEDVALRLPALASTLRHFDTVVSLNYDLILYWAHMLSNDTVHEVALKDCFIDGQFRADWRALRNPLPPTKKSILVFYPHGSLAFAVTPQGQERKIHVAYSRDLLAQIETQWQNDRWLPLFVREGTSQEKLSSIFRSNYLSTVLQDVLPTLGTSLAIFGWSFPEADDHILKSVLSGRVTRVAVSVHTANPDWRDFKHDVRRKIRSASRPNNRPRVEFFDAETMDMTTFHTQHPPAP